MQACSSACSFVPRSGSEVSLCASQSVPRDLPPPCSGLGAELRPPVIREQQGSTRRRAPWPELLALPSSTLCVARQGRSSAPQSLRCKLRGVWLTHIPAAASGRGEPASAPLSSRPLQHAHPPQAWKRLHVLLCPQICDKGPDLCRPSLIFFFPQILF